MKVNFVLCLIIIISIGKGTTFQLPNKLGKLTTLSNNVSNENKSVDNRIVGGVQTSIADHPYQLAMLKGGTFVCAGVIIANSWAITSAHCLDDFPSAQRIKFRAGSTNRLRGGILVTAVEYHLHDKYDYFTASYDVAVVKVSPNFRGINIKPIMLPSNEKELLDGDIVTLTGWGRTETGLLPINLRVVRVPVVGHTQCNIQWYNAIDETMLCAGVMGRDTCTGDSGGPLVYDNILYGLTSWGDAKCGGASPSVYCKLSHSEVRNFIRGKTGI